MNSIFNNKYSGLWRYQILSQIQMLIFINLSLRKKIILRIQWAEQISMQMTLKALELLDVLTGRLIVLTGKLFV